MAKVILKKDLCRNIFELWVEAPEIAANYLPGQFVMLRIREDGERVPLTVVDVDDRKEHIKLVVQRIGKTTDMLSLMKPGDPIPDILGPLGVPFEMKNYGRVLLIAGGVGVAVTYPIAKKLKTIGNSVGIVYGVRSSEFLIMKDELDNLTEDVGICSDDGSAFRKGVVTDMLNRMIADGEKIDLIYTAGPIPMMAAVASVAKKHSIPAIASINAIMVDGMGMCGSCRVTVDGRIKFACVDGPDFDAAKIDFEDLMRRQGRYREFEAVSRRLFESRQNGKEEI